MMVLRSYQLTILQEDGQCVALVVIVAVNVADDVLMRQRLADVQLLCGKVWEGVGKQLPA